MFKKYTITIGNNENQTHTICYKLNNSFVTQIWTELLIKTSPKDIRPNSNPWRGILIDWDKKISELNLLIKDLNLWIPDKINGFWNEIDNNESLNRLHIHFPELEKQEKNPIKIAQLSKYNDLIHEIQSLCNVKKNGREFMQLIICPETSSRKKIDLPEKCFEEFNHCWSFGDLVLHYCHVGRHPFEIFTSNDINCPSDHIIPQHSIYVYHSLKFFDLNFDLQQFKNFYYNSNINWPYSFEDPRLALGYIKMGELISVDNKDFDRSMAYSLVRNCNQILSWSLQ